MTFQREQCGGLAGREVIAEYVRTREGRRLNAPQTTKRYRLEVYGADTRNGQDRTLYYRTQAMARLNMFFARYLQAERIILVDTQAG